MNLPSLTRLLMEAGRFKVRGVGRIVGAPNWIDVCFDDYPRDDLLRFVHEFLNAAPELIAACEERDRYKADSEALDWAMKYLRLSKWPDRDLYHIEKRSISLTMGKDEIPEAIRKRLEGK